MFQGNNVYLRNGQAVMPGGPAADRLMAGNFGPTPNASAPPGYMVPQMAAALQGGVNGPQSAFLPQDGSFRPAQQPEAPPDLLSAQERMMIAQMLRQGEGMTSLGMGPVGQPQTPMYFSEAQQMLQASPQELAMMLGRSNA